MSGTKISLMKYSGVLILSIFIIIIVSAGAQNPDHYQLGSPELRALDSFFVELGLAPPFYSRPYSHHQYLHYLEQIEARKGGLSASNRTELAALIEKHR